MNKSVLLLLIVGILTIGIVSAIPIYVSSAIETSWYYTPEQIALMYDNDWNTFFTDAETGEIYIRYNTTETLSNADLIIKFKTQGPPNQQYYSYCMNNSMEYQQFGTNMITYNAEIIFNFTIPTECIDFQSSNGYFDVWITASDSWRRIYETYIEGVSANPTCDNGLGTLPCDLTGPLDYTTPNLIVNFTSITGTINTGDIQSGSNWIYVNSSSPANVPATITFNNITSSDYRPFKNGQYCKDCTNVVNDGTTLTFDVTGFSNYTYGNVTYINSCGNYYPNSYTTYVLNTSALGNLPPSTQCAKFGRTSPLNVSENFTNVEITCSDMTPINGSYAELILLQGFNAPTVNWSNINIHDCNITNLRLIEISAADTFTNIDGLTINNIDCITYDDCIVMSMYSAQLNNIDISNIYMPPIGEPQAAIYLYQLGTNLSNVTFRDSIIYSNLIDGITYFNFIDGTLITTSNITNPSRIYTKMFSCSDDPMWSGGYAPRINSNTDYVLETSADYNGFRNITAPKTYWGSYCLVLNDSITSLENVDITCATNETILIQDQSPNYFRFFDLSPTTGNLQYVNNVSFHGCNFEFNYPQNPSVYNIFPTVIYTEPQNNLKSIDNLDIYDLNVRSTSNAGTILSTQSWGNNVQPVLMSNISIHNINTTNILGLFSSQSCVNIYRDNWQIYDNVGTNMSAIVAFGDWCGGATLTNSYVNNSVFNINTDNWNANAQPDTGIATNSINYSVYFGLNPLTPLIYDNVSIDANCFSYYLIDGCRQNGTFYYNHLNTANVSVNFTNINGILNAADIQTGADWISVNSSSPANVPAHIQFNVTNSTYVPYRDGLICGVECSNIVNDGTHLNFDVTGFSNYSYGPGAAVNATMCQDINTSGIYVVNTPINFSTQDFLINTTTITNNHATVSPAMVNVSDTDPLTYNVPTTGGYYINFTMNNASSTSAILLSRHRVPTQMTAVVYAWNYTSSAWDTLTGDNTLGNSIYLSAYAITITNGFAYTLSTDYFSGGLIQVRYDITAGASPRWFDSQIYSETYTNNGTRSRNDCFYITASNVLVDFNNQPIYQDTIHRLVTIADGLSNVSLTNLYYYMQQPGINQYGQINFDVGVTNNSQYTNLHFYGNNISFNGATPGGTYIIQAFNTLDTFSSNVLFENITLKDINDSATSGGGIILMMINNIENFTARNIVVDNVNGGNEMLWFGSISANHRNATGVLLENILFQNIPIHNYDVEYLLLGGTQDAIMRNITIQASNNFGMLLAYDYNLYMEKVTNRLDLLPPINISGPISPLRLGGGVIINNQSNNNLGWFNCNNSLTSTSPPCYYNATGQYNASGTYINNATPYYTSTTCIFCTQSCSPCGGGCTATDLFGMYWGYDFITDVDNVGDITGWNTSCITSMMGLFYQSNFNQSIGNWDVSQVTTMTFMFTDSNFNQNISNWDTKSVTMLDAMFRNTPFNQDVSKWNISNLVQAGEFAPSMSTENYDKLLNGWSTQSVIPMGVYLWMIEVNTPNAVKYSTNGKDARDILTNTYGWNIVDGGLASVTCDGSLGTLPCDLSGPLDYTTPNLVVNFTSITGTINSGDIQSGSNWIYVNSSSPANVPATITLTNTFTNPIIYKDGAVCTTECNILSTNPLSFNVSGFSNYTVVSTEYLNYTTSGVVADANFTFEYYQEDTVTPTTEVQCYNNTNWNLILTINDNATLANYSAMIAADCLNLADTIQIRFSISTANYTLTNTALNYTNVVCSVCTESCSPCGGGCTATDLTGMYDSYDFDTDPSGVGNISGWNTSCITTMTGMFRYSSFNQDIGGWDTSAVTTMEDMFVSTPFNQDIGGWNTSAVTIMASMFGATPFNQDISGWDTSAVTTMQGMFLGATNFNQNISGWNTSAVIDMRFMFYNTPFNQDISSWNISQVTQMNFMFTGVTLSTTNYDALLNGWASQTVQTGVVFSGGSSKYTTTGVVGRDILTNAPNSWSITDGGYLAPSYTGNITYDGNYTIVTFYQNGTFIAPRVLNAELLIVAGGAGGGADIAGGGGAGGIIYNNSYPINITNYTITIGTGGIGAIGDRSSSAGIGTNGGDTIFDTLTAVGGGGGAGYNNDVGLNGGSGGGGGTTPADACGSSAGGTATIDQGNNGGAGQCYSGGGGGGAGSTGTNGGAGTSGPGGDGGIGYNSSINGTIVCYAGGGGGGAYGGVGGIGVCGAGNGNAGTSSADGYSAIDNTGAGGGGSGQFSLGGSGGSGIVIIRYLTNVLVAMPPNVTKFDGVTSNFTGLTLEQLMNYSGLILENTTNGKIEWDGVTNVNGADFDIYLNILHNFISVDSANLHTSLNSPANISIYNVYYNNPAILKDGVVCSECSIINNSGGIIQFAGNGFSNYTIISTEYRNYTTSGWVTYANFTFDYYQEPNTSITEIQCFDNTNNWINIGTITGN